MIEDAEFHASGVPGATGGGRSQSQIMRRANCAGRRHARAEPQARVSRLPWPCQAKRDGRDKPGHDRLGLPGGNKPVRDTMRRSACALALLLAALPARADYPERAVRIVVPVAAGGGIDVMARMLG